MFAKILTVAALVATVAAAPAAPAAPAAASTGGGVNACNVGSLQCCQSIQASNSTDFQNFLQGNTLLGEALGLGSTTVPVGLTCSPLSIAALGGNSCSAQPACCENNSFNGVVAVGCTPANLQL